MNHASLVPFGPPFFLNYDVWTVRESGDPGQHTGSAPGPPPHDWDAPRQQGTAMARLQHLVDDKFEDLKRHDLELLETVYTNPAKMTQLKDTEEICGWVAVLQALGADLPNIQTLACLAQQGSAGRIYANALLISWMKDAVDNKRLDYIMAPLVMQADLRKARQEIDRPPDWHDDHMVWHPGLALGPYWLPDIKHKAEDTRVAIGPGAWGDDDAGAYNCWDGGTWKRHWQWSSSWWLDRGGDRGFPWNTGAAGEWQWRSW